MVSIKTKLITLTSAGIFFTAILIGGVTIWRLTNVTDQNSKNALQLMCDKEKDKLDSSLGSIRNSVDSMKDVLLSSVGDLQKFSKDKAYREKLTKEFEELFYTIAYRTSSAVSYYVRYNSELIDDGAKGFLWTKRSRFASFSEMELTDINKYDSSDLEHVGWYYVPVKNRRATWMKPYENKNLNIYMVSYVVPLYVRGKLLGIVGMDADFTIIIDEINNMNVFKDGYAYITDDQEKIIYHKDYVLGTDGYETSKDIQEVSATMNNGWHVVVAVPKKELHAERDKMVLISIGLVIVIGALFIIITSQLTNKIVTPLIELKTATERVSEGDFEVKLSKVNNDEIGMLAATFKRTLSSLPEYLYTDSLTGLRNYSAYRRLVTQVEERMRSDSNLKFAVVECDISQLAQTNDSYGTEVGDQMLMASSKKICNIFAHSPVFRIGDDEFVILLENSDYENRSALLHRLNSEAIRVSVQDKEIEVPLAQGMSEYESGKDTSFMDVFKRADNAMIEHKRQLKNRIRII